MSCQALSVMYHLSAVTVACVSSYLTAGCMLYLLLWLARRCEDVITSGDKAIIMICDLLSGLQVWTGMQIAHVCMHRTHWPVTQHICVARGTVIYNAPYPGRPASLSLVLDCLSRLPRGAAGLVQVAHWTVTVGIIWILGSLWIHHDGMN